MKYPLPLLLLIALSWSLVGCNDQPASPNLTLTSVDGSEVDINAESSLTALFFFSVSNPAATGEFNQLADKIDSAAETYAIAMNVDRPPNIHAMQLRSIVPIVIDEKNRISDAFGKIDLTPHIVLLKEGKILMRQQGLLDYAELNAAIKAHR